VGVSRDARIDGYTPAIIPTSTAPPSPVSAEDSGTTTGQPWYAAYSAVPPSPSAVPAIPPRPASSTDSVRNWPRICPRLAPSARRRPISARRSSTEITMVLATPMPPTSNATAASPRNSAE
jgi:hypothetical protein